MHSNISIRAIERKKSTKFCTSLSQYVVSLFALQVPFRINTRTFHVSCFLIISSL